MESQEREARTGEGPSRRRRRRSGRKRPGPRAQASSERRSSNEPESSDELVVSAGRPFSELGLDERLARALADRGYEMATPIQAGSIPVALEGRDILGQAQTGSGKTAAYGLVALQRILSLSGGGKGVKALVITPTRELAMQVTEEIAKLARHADIRLLAVVGGQDIDVQAAAIRDRVDLLVGTPGRLLDLMYRGILDLGEVVIGIVDEADEMLNMGFVDDVEMILSCLPPERQTLMFSATIPARIKRLADGFMRDHVHVRVENTEETLPDIDHRYLIVKPERRFDLLQAVLERLRGQKCIVFCRTKVRVHQVAGRLGRSVDGLGVLEGDMEQGERNRVMRKFRRGEVKVLVATDVVARGIDVKDVTYVINFDCPDDVDSYVHRVGRTARAGRSGTSLTFVEPREERLLKAIERRVGKLAPYDLDGGTPPEDDAGRGRMRKRGDAIRSGEGDRDADAGDGRDAGSNGDAETVQDANHPREGGRRRRRRRRSGPRRGDSQPGDEEPRTVEQNAPAL